MNKVVLSLFVLICLIGMSSVVRCEQMDDLSDELLAEIESEFSLIDYNGDQIVSRNELQKYFELNKDIDDQTKELIIQEFNKADLNGDTNVDLNEFIEFTRQHHSSEHQEDDQPSYHEDEDDQPSYHEEGDEDEKNEYDDISQEQAEDV